MTFVFYYFLNSLLNFLMFSIGGQLADNVVLTYRHTTK